MSLRACEEIPTHPGGGAGTAASDAKRSGPAHPTPSAGLSNLIHWIMTPPDTAPRATILIRGMAGWVFFWEGVIKFVFVNQGVGRFTKIGMPWPEVLAPAIAMLEIIGGLALIVGFLTRPFALLFVAEMIVAILSTKVSLFLGSSPLALPPVPPQTGFWAVLHEWRSDIAQLLCCLFLLLEGSGPWSIDAMKRAHLAGTDTAAAVKRRQPMMG